MWRGPAGRRILQRMNHAPGWIILPAAFVLGYTYLMFKNGDPHARGFAVAWQGVCSVAGLAALGAVVWWAGTLFSLS
jgi:hypothetical protein